MLQTELNRAVASATGESISTIARQGFSYIEAPPVDHEPLVVDWDANDARLLGAMFD
jgi:hypothetical protein